LLPPLSASPANWTVWWKKIRNSGKEDVGRTDASSPQRRLEKEKKEEKEEEENEGRVETDGWEDAHTEKKKNRSVS
jgi:transposase-like protein